MPNNYMVSIASDIHLAIDDADDRKYYMHAIKRDMGRRLADHIIHTKIGEVRTHNPTPVTQRHTLELYVMTAEEFNREVRREAKKYNELMLRHPVPTGSLG